jgi:hypothetical protein
VTRNLLSGVDRHATAEDEWRSSTLHVPLQRLRPTDRVAAHQARCKRRARSDVRRPPAEHSSVDGRLSGAGQFVVDAR